MPRAPNSSRTQEIRLRIDRSVVQRFRRRAREEEVDLAPKYRTGAALSRLMREYGDRRDKA